MVATPQQITEFINVSGTDQREAWYVKREKGQDLEERCLPLSPCPSLGAPLPDCRPISNNGILCAQTPFHSLHSTLTWSHVYAWKGSSVYRYTVLTSDTKKVCNKVKNSNERKTLRIVTSETRSDVGGDSRAFILWKVKGGIEGEMTTLLIHESSPWRNVSV